MPSWPYRGSEPVLAAPGAGDRAPRPASRAGPGGAAPARGCPPGRLGRCTCRPPCAPPPRTSRRGAGAAAAAAAPRRPARGGPRGPGGQPGAVRRRRRRARWRARQRMAAVKGAVLSLLRDAYQRRDKVGLITFRGAGAELVLPPTSSVTRPASARLAELPTGGRTPLAAGLLRRPHDLLRGGAAARPAPAARWSWWSPTAGPPAAPEPLDAVGAPRRPSSPPTVRRAWWWTASPARSGSAWPAGWPPRSARQHLPPRTSCAADPLAGARDRRTIGGPPDAAGTSRATCPTTG